MPSSVAALEDLLTRPSPALIADLAALDGDLLVLGVGGKMGPSLAVLARRALDAAGSSRQVLGVARFSTPGVRESLEAAGVRTLAADLLDRRAVAALPDAPNLIFMAGQKFGSTGAESRTWAMNTWLPGLVAERYAGARTVVFSSGNVYPLVPVASGGATEATPPAPVGEYAQSVLGRERVFEHFARTAGTPTVLFRLNYAVELRYGVLLDVAQRVWRGEPVALSNPAANCLWQGDANAMALRCLRLAASPPLVLNVTGPETVAIRALAHRFGELLDREPSFAGDEPDSALLANAQRAHGLLGYPTVPLDQVIRWVAEWVRADGPTLAKPTHFETRDGRF